RRGGANVQRTQNVEATYNLELGSRTFSVGYFHESVNNGALTLSVPQEFYMNDLLPDLSSNSSVFNIGNYSQSGYTLSATQIFDENYSASISAGRAGVLTTDDPHLRTADPDELRAKIRSGQRHWLRGRVAGMAPVTHTRFVASYEWTDYAALTPGHVFLTQRINPETGLNLRIRQPLPAWGNLPGRLEASAEFRNLLAQGYLPVGLPDGRRLILAHTPRSIRGGFSFIF
ncbi:MAG TPA: hypothetical protein VEQ63_13100, partial [Bryobacteraceae bacterium]|nr:hypothetical protein [Bryobacteraceae bacterium]